MTADDLRKYLPNASQSLLAINADRAGKDAILERAARHEPLAKKQGQEADTGRVHIRFVSVRKRLLDPDNLAEKWHLDCLRYCKAIRGDEPEKITLETTQRKAGKEEAEHTQIEIFQITQTQ
jgi:hypothetical protein